MWVVEEFASWLEVDETPCRLPREDSSPAWGATGNLGPAEDHSLERPHLLVHTPVPVRRGVVGCPLPLLAIPPILLPSVPAVTAPLHPPPIGQCNRAWCRIAHYQPQLLGTVCPHRLKDRFHTAPRQPWSPDLNH